MISCMALRLAPTINAVHIAAMQERDVPLMCNRCD